MDKNILINYLENAFKIVFCDRLTGSSKENMGQNVENFFREGISYYNFEELIEQFSPPEKGIKLFFDYIKASEEQKNQIKH